MPPQLQQLQFKTRCHNKAAGFKNRTEAGPRMQHRQLRRRSSVKMSGIMRLGDETEASPSGSSWLPRRARRSPASSSLPLVLPSVHLN